MLIDGLPLDAPAPHLHDLLSVGLGAEAPALVSALRSMSWRELEFEAELVATPLNYRYTHREIDHAVEVSTTSTGCSARSRSGRSRSPTPRSRWRSSSPPAAPGRRRASALMRSRVLNEHPAADLAGAA